MWYLECYRYYWVIVDQRKIMLYEDVRCVFYICVIFKGGICLICDIVY